MAEEYASPSSTASQEEEQLKNRNLIIYSMAEEYHTDALTKPPMTLSSFVNIKPSTGSVKKLVIRNFKGNVMIILKKILVWLLISYCCFLIVNWKIYKLMSTIFRWIWNIIHFGLWRPGLSHVFTTEIISFFKFGFPLKNDRLQ